MQKSIYHAKKVSERREIDCSTEYDIHVDGMELLLELLVMKLISENNMVRIFIDIQRKGIWGPHESANIN